MNNKITRRMRNAIHFITGTELANYCSKGGLFFFTKNSKYSRCVKKVYISGYFLRVFSIRYAVIRL